MLYEFIESSLFQKYLPDYLTDERYTLLQHYLCENPNAGDLVKGSGGVRKLRWAREGTGKSGGVRACYYRAIAYADVVNPAESLFTDKGL